MASSLPSSSSHFPAGTSDASSLAAGMDVSQRSTRRLSDASTLTATTTDGSSARVSDASSLLDSTADGSSARVSDASSLLDSTTDTSTLATSTGSLLPKGTEISTSG